MHTAGEATFGYSRGAVNTTGGAVHPLQREALHALSGAPGKTSGFLCDKWPGVTRVAIFDETRGALFASYLSRQVAPYLTPGAFNSLYIEHPGPL